MNNKRLGTAFERKVCDKLSKAGFWVHFLTPDNTGAQPFDIIAVKNGCAVAIECKTLSTNRRYFTIDRLEENQKLAFMKWKECNNTAILIMVEYGDSIKIIKYEDLEKLKKIDMKELENEA